MRTTVTLDDALVRRAKQQAVRTGQTLSSLIEAALRDALARRPATSVDYRFTLVTHRGSGSRPGVDLSDNEAVRDLMDGL